MISLRFALVVSMVLAFAAAMTPQVKAATPLIAESADKVVSLRNVTTTTSEVSGEVVNNSKDTVRDVNVEILYSWRWNNERHPGTDDPGRAVYQTVNSEIAPGQSTRFNYRASPPLSERKDGHFEITVKVVGFTQVYR